MSKPQPLKFLFIFAHPDDESVSCAGTIMSLVAAGHQVQLIVVTDGAAGQVLPEAQMELAKVGNLRKLRQLELQKVAAAMGVREVKFLDFADGELNNKLVWGQLKERLISELEAAKPDFLITFEHTGWYYHLDHVGVSIACTLAFHEAQHHTQGLLLAHLRVGSTKWKYAFPEKITVTHVVDASKLREQKLSLLALHASQNTTPIEHKIMAETTHLELFQGMFMSQVAKKLLTKTKIFTPIRKEHHWATQLTTLPQSS